MEFEFINVLSKTRRLLSKCFCICGTVHLQLRFIAIRQIKTFFLDRQRMVVFGLPSRKGSQSLRSYK